MTSQYVGDVYPLGDFIDAAENPENVTFETLGWPQPDFAGPADGGVTHEVQETATGVRENVWVRFGCMYGGTCTTGDEVKPGVGGSVVGVGVGVGAGGLVGDGSVAGGLVAGGAVGGTNDVVI